MIRSCIYNIILKVINRDIIITPCISLRLLLRPRHICSKNLWPSVTKNIKIYSDGTEVAIWKNSLHFLPTSYVGLYGRTLCNSSDWQGGTWFLLVPTCPNICSLLTWYKTCWCIWHFISLDLEGQSFKVHRIILVSCDSVSY